MQQEVCEQLQGVEEVRWLLEEEQVWAEEHLGGRLWKLAWVLDEVLLQEEEERLGGRLWKVAWVLGEVPPQEEEGQESDEQRGKQQEAQDDEELNQGLKPSWEEKEKAAQRVEQEQEEGEEKKHPLLLRLREVPQEEAGLRSRLLHPQDAAQPS